MKDRDECQDHFWLRESVFSPSDDLRFRIDYHVKVGNMPTIFQSKTLTVKNKNKIFPKFLSPSITTTYSPRASGNGRIFDSKVPTRLIIEALLFCPQLRNFEYEI